jgi:tagatose 1,6-diphosphate aldolase
VSAISAGKLRGLLRLADARGFFTMLAVDQRPPIMNHLRSVQGDAPDAAVTAVKRTLLRNLGPGASAVLCDPVWAYPFAPEFVAPSQGLIVTLEDHRFEDTPGGRRATAIPGWSVEKIKRMGADGVKVLAHYRPDADPDVNAHQQDFVRGVGEDCRRFDLPFVFELLVYPLQGRAPDQLDDPDRHAALVLDSVRIFADPTYGVDVFKLESPIPAAQVPDPDGAGAGAIQRMFDELGRLAGRPWVLLSAGATAEAFARTLTFAARAGASGFLAGRAIWWQAFQHYPDLDAMAGALRADAVPYMERLQALTAMHGRPWREGPIELAAAGLDFPQRYGGMA